MGEAAAWQAATLRQPFSPLCWQAQLKKGVAQQGITQLGLFAGGTGERLQYSFLAIDPHSRPSIQRKSGVVQKPNRKYFLFLCFREQISSGVVCC